MALKICHKVSKLFQPLSVTPKNALVKNQEITSKSQKLMLDLGIIRQANPGIFHYLPLGVRAVEKLIKVIDKEMHNIDAQKVIFSSLINAKLWRKTGRLDNSTELFKVADRHKSVYILSPTHEEAASDLLASVSPISYKQFPLRLYQITSKYRDEMKPRFGLMRGRQFLMKDLYCFDLDDKSALETYELVCNAYDKIFETVGLKTVKVLGSSGAIGGTLSHEFHFIAEIGEDKIKSCTDCNESFNTQLHNDPVCRNCKSSNLSTQQGIEVGHTFLLGEKYSKPLNAQYISPEKKPITLKMGSYGLGVSRIVAAAIEVLSREEEIRWPKALVPYSVIIIPPKEGSKEEALMPGLAEKLYHLAETVPHLRENVLFDDRTTMTIGRRQLEARRMGYPYIIMLGKRATESPPMFEMYKTNSNETVFLSESELLKFLSDSSVD